MAIIVDTSTNLGSTATTSLTAAHVCTGTNLILFVAVYNFQSAPTASDTVTGVTYAASAMTKIGSSVQVPSNAGYWVSFWYLIAPATGSNNVVVSLSANNNVCYAVSASYKSVFQTGTIDVNGSNTANATSISTTLTTTVGNDWTIAAVQATDGTLAAGAGTTLRQAGPAANAAIFDSNAPVGIGSTSLTATISPAKNMAMIMAAFKPILDGGSFISNFI